MLIDWASHSLINTVAIYDRLAEDDLRVKAEVLPKVSGHVYQEAVSLNKTR